MTSWNDFASAEPDFSRRVLELFETQNIYLPPNIFGYAGERSFF